MAFFSTFLRALNVIKGRAPRRREPDDAARPPQTFSETVTKLMSAAGLPTTEREAAVQEIDQAARGNPAYESVRKQLLSSVGALDMLSAAHDRLDAIARLPSGERDAMAQMLDQSMRGIPHYEVARAQILSRGDAASRHP